MQYVAVRPCCCSRLLAARKLGFVRRYSTHYDTLGVRKSASKKEIKSAFVRLSKELHPDRNPNDPKLHNKFVRLNEAYTVLSKPSSRQQYDMSLQTDRPGAAPPPFTHRQQYGDDFRRYNATTRERAQAEEKYWEEYYRNSKGPFSTGVQQMMVQLGIFMTLSAVLTVALVKYMDRNYKPKQRTVVIDPKTGRRKVQFVEREHAKPKKDRDDVKDLSVEKQELYFKEDKPLAS